MRKAVFLFFVACARFVNAADIVLYSTVPPASQPASPVCTNVWTRPTCWPVGSGYTVDTWTTPETNLLKWVTLGSSSETIKLQTGSAAPFFVDWYADGVHVSNYANLAVATFSYPDNMRDRYIPVKAGYTNGAMPSLYFASVNLYATNAVFDSKFTKTVEVIFSATNSVTGGSILQSFYELEHARSDCAALAGNTFYADPLLKKVDIPLCKLINASALYNCQGLREVYAPAVTSVLASAMQACYSLRGIDMPLCQNLGNSAFKDCRRMSSLTPMPNLTTVGTEVFRNCNLQYAVITNFVLRLGTSSAAYQTLDFRDNPGTPELMSWYVSGTVSNDLASLGWNIKF